MIISPTGLQCFNHLSTILGEIAKKYDSSTLYASNSGIKLEIENLRVIITLDYPVTVIATINITMQKDIPDSYDQTVIRYKTNNNDENIKEILLEFLNILQKTFKISVENKSF